MPTSKVRKSWQESVFKNGQVIYYADIAWRNVSSWVSYSHGKPYGLGIVTQIGIVCLITYGICHLIKLYSIHCVPALVRINIMHYRGGGAYRIFCWNVPKNNNSSIF